MVVLPALLDAVIVTKPSFSDIRGWTQLRLRDVDNSVSELMIVGHSITSLHRWINDLDCNTVVLRSSDGSTRDSLSGRDQQQQQIKPVKSHV